MKPINFIFLGILFFSFSASTLADAPPSIQGKIVEVRGYAMHGLTVRARNNFSGAEYETISDDKGSFTLSGLEPGRYTLVSECEGLDRILGSAVVEASKTTQVELLAFPLAETGNTAIDKFVASSAAQGGRYPAGNISYLNVNDALDLYFMWVYFLILGLSSVYGVYRYRLVYLFLRYQEHRPQPKSKFANDRLPRITVQLPLFNEMYVAERLIDAVVKLEYPAELLEIQVLDDSTDDTQMIDAAAVKKYRDQGVDITHRHRQNREGFKAGALEAGLKSASGELVLIFDADFVPRPDCI